MMYGPDESQNDTKVMEFAFFKSDNSLIAKKLFEDQAL